MIAQGAGISAFGNSGKFSRGGLPRHEQRMALGVRANQDGGKGLAFGEIGNGDFIVSGLRVLQGVVDEVVQNPVDQANVALGERQTRRAIDLQCNTVFFRPQAKLASHVMHQFSE